MNSQLSVAICSARLSTPGVMRGVGLAALLALSGCATSSPAYHSYIMQGQVLAVEGNTLTLCIGERDGASVGQVLNVVRHVQQSASPKSTAPNFRREPIGTARIARVFDEHYATAVIVDGQPMVNDVAELKAK